jgi:hypothetical protein
MSLLESDPFKSQRPSFLNWGCLTSLVGLTVAGTALYLFINQAHPTTDTDGGMLVYGMTVYDALDRGEEDEWTFEAQEGDTISVRMNGSFDTYLEIEANGRSITSNDDGGDGTNSHIDSFTLPSDGTYTIIARAFSDGSGSYSLELQRLSSGEEAAVAEATLAPSENPITSMLTTPRPSSSDRIEYGATVRGEVTDETGEEWTFRGNEGDVVTIDMTGEFDTYLVLYNEDRLELVRDDDNGEGSNARIAYYVLPYDGEYIILARGFGGRTGSYELTLTSSDALDTPAPARAGTIEFGQTVRGDVNDQSGESWTFRGNEDDIVVIDMVGDFDTYLLLFDSDNRQLTQDDDSGEGTNSRINFYTLPHDGTYTIVARGWGGDTGSYELTITTVDSIPTMTPAPTSTSTPQPSRAGTIEYGQTVRGTVRDGAGESWTFRANEDDIVVIDMVGDFDTYLLLYDSDNRELTRDDDSGEDYNARISFYTLPHDGTYTIVARGWGSNTGSYELTITTVDTIPTLTPVPTLTPTPMPSRAGSIEFGQTVDGRVSDWGGDAWTFTGERGDEVMISLDGDNFDTYLVLTDSDYQQLAADDDSGEDLDSLITEFRLPRDGTYIIVARGFFGRTGSYTLTLTLED